MITEELYNFCLHYADNISIREYGSVDHKGFRITYMDTVPTILRLNKENGEVQHNDELLKKGTDFIVFMLLWGFERRDQQRFAFIEQVNEDALTDKAVMDFLIPRMRDKKRFLDDFGWDVVGQIAPNKFRFKRIVDSLESIK